MFKLPNGIPSLTSSAQDWADYAEYNAWVVNGDSLSFSNLFKSPKLVSDEIDIEGVEDDSDKFSNKIDEISYEIRLRSTICGDRYPFVLVNRDYGLQYKPSDEFGSLIYRYLLLCTRINMSRDRIIGNLDGALLFEFLCAEVAVSYFGNKAEVEVFGTSKEDSVGFRGNLRNLIQRLGEGGNIHEHVGHKPKDEKLDLVVGKSFSDRRPSKMIGFGQCKTGTSWVDKLSELDPYSFCSTWFTSQPVVTPVRMFFCAQYFPNDIWEVRAKRAGLVFDRFRIMDYLPNDINNDLLNRLESWTSKAFESYNSNYDPLK